jgi:hypothetical protein
VISIENSEPWSQDRNHRPVSSPVMTFPKKLETEAARSRNS